MTRSLNASLISELATNKLNPVELVYLGVSTGTYYTDHYKDITYDGNTYTSSSLFLGASEANESSEIGVNNLVLKFSGADQTIISLFLNNDYMDKRAWVYRGFLVQLYLLVLLHIGQILKNKKEEKQILVRRNYIFQLM
jgi:hypothetical protein